MRYCKVTTSVAEPDADPDPKFLNYGSGTLLFFKDLKNFKKKVHSKIVNDLPELFFHWAHKYPYRIQIRSGLLLGGAGSGAERNIYGLKRL
jgi:hypothetical protein